ncbi:MAG: dephospho-CoA kinase [Phycisphaerales bacterium]|nr:dephospho-CoA kinase [Phycisphaerales bacterium]MCB9836623.1 dephospho-CoA kinase [Phycisphaera sp.]
MSEPVVIGLAGGIGSGKSFVAAMLAEAGCVIYDADREVTALYKRQDVLDTVRSWWGDEAVIDGEIDRATIARIIFEDESQRDRLEKLLFPRLHERRRELIESASRNEVKAVVIDAPLLFEAALDEECDVVVFVDTPRGVRLERLRARSGWDEAELSRREKAQLPLDAKRQRSDYSLDGSAAPEELRRRTLSLLDEIIAGRDDD